VKILVTGGHGQLGRSVAQYARTHGHDVVALGRDELDICGELRFPACDLLINAAAYTAVDKAEAECERAFAVNRDGVTNLAKACHERGTRLLHVSTDYVFDGKAMRPYREDDPPAPVGVYGASKAAGERAVLALGGTVVRTSWLFGEGGPSFVHTIMRLARDRSVLRVVADQHGCPTYAGDLAEALLELASAPAAIYHYCNDGPTTWHGFAVAIVERMRSSARVDAITTADYPTPARRPAYSVLDTTRVRALGIVPPPWTVGLARVVDHALLEG